MKYSHLIHTFSHLKTRCESALDSMIVVNYWPIFTPLYLFTVKSCLAEIGCSRTAVAESFKKGVRCESKPVILYSERPNGLHTSILRCETRCENAA